MKIAYLVSRHPAVSHTFILHEVLALRARGHRIDTFSVRQATREDILGPEAKAEAANTRFLVPPNLMDYTRAFAWALTNRPLQSARALWEALGHLDVSPVQRIMWCCYFVESILFSYWVVRGKDEHIHCHFGNNGSNTAYLASIITGRPFSMTLHGIDLDQCEKFRLPQKIAHSKFTICISKTGKARMMRLLPPKDWAKIRVVHCGPKTAAGAPLSPITAQGRLLCVARLSSEKGHLILFDALKRLHDEGLNFTCTLVGDGPLRESLEKRVDELNLRDHVVFKGALPSEQVAACYIESDAVVLASFDEGIPLVLMEAMAAGRPVISTRLGTITELVEHGTNGYLCSPGNANDLAEALALFLRDPEKAQGLGEAAAATVAQRFTIEAGAEKLEALFTA